MSSRVFAIRCPTDMSTTGSRPTNMGPLIAAVSAVHLLWVTGVCVLYLSPYPIMGICLAFHLQIPSSPYPSLTFSQSMEYTAPRSTVQVFVFHNYGLTLPGYLNNTVTWAYMKVPTKDPQVVYIQFVFPQSGNTKPIKWSWIHAYRCHLWEDPHHHTMVGIVLS